MTLNFDILDWRRLYLAQNTDKSNRRIFSIAGFKVGFKVVGILAITSMYNLFLRIEDVGISIILLPENQNPKFLFSSKVSALVSSNEQIRHFT